jgi:acyl-CoA thioester hydrolase
VATSLSQHRIRRRVQFYETDAAGIVHFSWFPRYMEEAEHDMWRTAGLSIHDEDSPYGWPRVAVSFDYFAPLRFEDRFDVTIRITEMGARSIRYACDISKGEIRVAAGTMTISCVERNADGQVRSTAIPGAVLARFRPVGTPV